MCIRDRITGVLCNLFSSILALTLHFFQFRNRNRQKLHDNGGCDVRGNAQCEDRHGRKRTAGHRIEKAKCIIALTLKEILKEVSLYSRNRQFGSKTDDYQHQEGEDQFLSDLLNLPCISECLPPVSYTHLDVYKRQSLDGSSFTVPRRFS